jgi:hypothetical protein
MKSVSKIERSEDDPTVISKGPRPRASDGLARGLGWLSIALGVTELIAAERLASALGMRGQEHLIRAYGVREIGSGVVSLSVDKDVGLWTRVAGDGLDIATLAGALRRDNPKRANVGLALGMVLGVTLLDVVAAQGVRARRARSRGKVRDYSRQSGFPQGVNAARGLARRDLDAPRDMRAAPVLQTA